ncbi:hypothetical protein BC936DRAFT_136771 [Jimgerdemannia flammicorona]|uniref:Uncharacterized protein n=1 Tax=Jimgerdemannia flammicorona TaxID=994334 RepID=A0A433CYU7_9FUNG|nr:hypothetical protein BC936DRAFT_136771 [Jimgerdemannia flammicorona]
MRNAQLIVCTTSMTKNFSQYQKTADIRTDIALQWEHQIEYFSQTTNVLAIDMVGCGKSDVVGGGGEALGSMLCEWRLVCLHDDLPPLRPHRAPHNTLPFLIDCPHRSLLRLHARDASLANANPPPIDPRPCPPLAQGPIHAGPGPLPTLRAVVPRLDRGCDAATRQEGWDEVSECGQVGGQRGERGGASEAVEVESGEQNPRVEEDDCRSRSVGDEDRVGDGLRTSVACGRKGVVSPHDMYEIRSCLLQNAHATLTATQVPPPFVIPGAGHQTMLEKPELVNPVALNFLNKSCGCEAMDPTWQILHKTRGENKWDLKNYEKVGR